MHHARCGASEAEGPDRARRSSGDLGDRRQAGHRQRDAGESGRGPGPERGVARPGKPLLGNEISNPRVNSQGILLRRTAVWYLPSQSASHIMGGPAAGRPGSPVYLKDR